MTISHHDARLKYQWVCWTLGLSVAAFAGAIVFAGVSEPATMALYFVSIVSTWAYISSLGRLATALGRRGTSWAGAAFLTSPVGGPLIAFFMIRSIYHRETRVTPVAAGMKVSSDSGAKPEGRTQMEERKEFDPKVAQILQASMYMMDVSHQGCAAKIRESTSPLPLDARAIVELAALDAFAVIHATHPALSDIANPDQKRDAVITLVNHASECWRAHFPEVFRTEDAYVAFVKRLKDYEKAFIEGVHGPNGPFWAVAKQFLALCLQERSGIHAMMATQRGAAKFRSVVQLLNEIAQEPVMTP